jgi:hypothetical protein
MNTTVIGTPDEGEHVSSDYYGALSSDLAEHFPGCHPEDAEDRQKKPLGELGGVEDCWHCGTPTSRGCNCADCWDGADYVPPSAIYHCPTCKRWWAWMTGLNITTIA